MILFVNMKLFYITECIFHDDIHTYTLSEIQTKLQDLTPTLDTDELTWMDPHTQRTLEPDAPISSLSTIVFGVVDTDMFVEYGSVQL